MKKIGIISDTHGKIPAEIYDIFTGVDEIWHAGDIGGSYLLDELESIAPVQCVCGNVDGYPICTEFPERKKIKIGNFYFLLIHRFFDESDRIFPSVKGLLNENFNAIIYGHTHVPDLRNGINDTLFFNPGSPTSPRRGSEPSVGILTIFDNDSFDFQFYFLKK